MTDRRSLVLRALLAGDELTAEEIAQTSWDDRRQARRHRLTDAGRERLAEGTE